MAEEMILMGDGNRAMLIHSTIHIPCAVHRRLAADMAERCSGRGREDLDEALANFNLIALRDKDGNVDGLERAVSDDSFAGDEIYEVLAPYVRAKDCMTWRDKVDGSYYQIAFDGQGGYEKLGARFWRASE